MSPANALTHGAHVLLYPYPAPGHTIPMLDLANKLLDRNLSVTVLVIPSNYSLLEPLLTLYPSTLHPLVLAPNEEPFKAKVQKLMSKMRAMRELDSQITNFFKSHPSPPVAIISDFFLGWTHHLAFQLGIPRITFSPSGAYGFSVANSVWTNQPTLDEPDIENFPLTFHDLPNSPVFPWWQITHLYREAKKDDPDKHFFRESWLGNTASWGIVLNSLTEFERVYIEHLKKELGHPDRVWAVGPLLPSPEDPLGPENRGGFSSVPSHEVLTWLDHHPGNSVVYICFGSRATLTRPQTEILANALESSGVRFIWCVRDTELPDGYEERAGDKGFVIKGWAPQVSILRHKAVGAFLTHCGWNSTLEGLSAGVVMLTWPRGADQFTNASLLVDQLGVGVRIGGGSKWILEPDELAKTLAESVEEDRPERVRAMELSEAASSAVKGGSSERDLDDLVKRLNELESEKISAFG